MTDPQTEARAIALEPLNDLARKKNLFIDNAATASQTDFDEVTREAIELNVIAPLILALSERDTALAAKDAELSDVRRLLENEKFIGASSVADWFKRAERAEAALAKAMEALEAMVIAMNMALGHIEHMAKFIGARNLGYSFESLGEDNDGMRQACNVAEAFARRAQGGTE